MAHLVICSYSNINNSTQCVVLIYKIQYLILQGSVNSMEILIQELTHFFDGKKLFDSLSFSFQGGKFYFLRGSSGSGKSTLLKMLVNLCKPDKGNIQFSEKLEVINLRCKVQLLPQLPVIIPGTVQDNLIWPFTLPLNKEKMPDRKTLENLCTRFFPEGMTLNKEAGNLSQGQKQRLAVARVLLLDPEVLLCDEPTSALDENSRRIVDEGIRDFFLSNSQKMVIYISHHKENFSVNGKEVLLELTSRGLSVL